mmetsp:Transcript_26691/g.50595  ORF Transcript_26691/g.50595 Transcript_26691/m.50595 type:complete len:90 (+) Transcript_26691:1908-2177(+)
MEERQRRDWAMHFSWHLWRAAVGVRRERRGRSERTFMGLCFRTEPGKMAHVLLAFLKMLGFGLQVFQAGFGRGFDEGEGGPALTVNLKK